MSCSLFSNLTICCLKALSHSRRLWWDNEPKQKEFQSVSPNKNHSSLFLHLRFYRLNQWVLIIELWAWLRAVTSQPQEVLTARSGYSLQCRPLNFRQNQTGCRSFIWFLTGKQMSIWWTSAVGPPRPLQPRGSCSSQWQWCTSSLETYVGTSEYLKELSSICKLIFILFSPWINLRGSGNFTCMILS